MVVVVRGSSLISHVIEWVVGVVVGVVVDVEEIKFDVVYCLAGSLACAVGRLH